MATGRRLMEEIEAERPQQGECSFWWLGQLGYALRTARLQLFIDPFLSGRDTRQHAPILEAGMLRQTDYLFGTHMHDDHIDLPVWRLAAKEFPKLRFIVPRALKKEICALVDLPPERVIGVADGETVQENGLEITGIAAAHELLQQDENGDYLQMGYYVRADGISFYHSGDCCIYEGLYGRLRALKSPDIAFLPINGRDGKRLRANCIGNMTYQEAVDLCGMLRPGLSVPGHYDMFAANSENPLLFSDYLDAKYPGLRCWIGPHGTKVTVKAGQ